MMPLLEPRGADDDRFLRRGAGIERRLDRPWRGEIDQNVGHGRELRDIAALVNAAAALSRLRYRGRERDAHPARAADDARSEEHTSELQSLMRISYAVFCLKKKTKTQTSEQIHPALFLHSRTHTTTKI